MFSMDKQKNNLPQLLNILALVILFWFQLVKHFSGLQSLLSTLGQVSKEISLLMVLICVCVLTLAR